MSGFLTELLASASLFLRQPLESFCDVETNHTDAAHQDRLVTLRGEYVSVLRVNGLRTMCSRADVEAVAEQQRIELQGLLEGTGHAIEGWYISDPDQARVAVDLLALNG
ncbi:ATP-binding protein, partial [Gluconobacter kondonii]|nr:ATP-binding protein [Gluconobacter kondonii]